MKRSPITRTKSLKPVSDKRRLRSGKVGKMGIVRLYGPDLEALRRECFERDGYQCQYELRREDLPEYGMVRIFRCWQKVTWETGEMAHIRTKRNNGDTLDNVRTLCPTCHHREHNPKVVPAKDKS